MLDLSPSPSQPVAPPGRIVAIHTSDRGSFKSCRRRWHWGSHLGLGLEPFAKASPLWFGSGIHFALQDYHGIKMFNSPAEAFELYYRESFKEFKERMPDDHHDLRVLGKGMMDYYVEWLETRDRLETYVVNGVPQVEIQFEIPLPVPQSALDRAGIAAVVYRGTIDRVSVDTMTGLLWIVEYKTAKIFRTTNYIHDPQVTAYMWAMSCIYDRPCGGVVYQQHKKEVPDEPRWLASGKISADSSQRTTHRLYRAALKKMYGNEFSAWPAANVNCLNQLAAQEGEEADDYVRRDRIAMRGEYQLMAEGAKIMLEVDEMINPNLALYPHKGLHCPMCSFQHPCVSLDDGSYWEEDLNDPTQFVPRIQESNLWQTMSNLKRAPLQLQGVIPQKQLQYLHQHPTSP